MSDALTALPSELDARRELARAFRIESLLERSPGRIVYLARDAAERPLTLKVVPRAQLAADRFHAPVHPAVGLDHPHIVPVQGRGATENFLWCATKHVEGRSLRAVLQEKGFLELSVGLRICEQVASALDYAHRRGAAHGDLTPDCVIVDTNLWVLVGDFAISGLHDASPHGAQASDPAARGDQRALAALIHYCLTGAPLGDGAPPPESGRPALPLHVSQAIRRAASSRPADRFPSVLDFVAALGGMHPDPQTAWAPVVIAETDADPAASQGRGRVAAAAAAAAGLVIALAVGVAWLSTALVPAAPASRPSTASARAPALDPAPAPAPAPPTPATRVSPRAVAPPPPAVRATRPPVPRRPAPPVPNRVPQRAEPALLSVNAIPWGSVYVDGRPVGNTPQIDLPLAPGPHRLRVERDGFRPYERGIAVAPGQRLRITDIALVEQSR